MAFKAANDVLLGSVQGIADLIIRPGLMNLDFADVRAVMAEMGMAMMGSGRATGEDRARIAAEAAVRSPLLEDIDLRGARGILVNITAGPDLSLGEFTEVGEIVEEFASDNATVVVGTAIDPAMGDQLRVTVVATGLGQGHELMAVPTLSRGRGSDPMPDYRELSRPAIIRRNGLSHDGGAARKLDISSDKDQEYLDIPAFLRRQAD
jgi:cell division protein FtsZ